MAEKEYVRLIGTDKVAATDGTWSQVTRKGNFVFVSGQVSLDSDGNLVGEGDFEQQARQALDNLVACLESVGAHLDNLMMITVFVTDMNNRTIFAKVRDGYFREILRPVLLLKSIVFL